MTKQDQAVQIELTPDRMAEIMAECNVEYKPGMGNFIRAIEREVRSAAREQARNEAQWISVDERLPKPETDVLIVRLGQIRVGAIFIERESWEEGGRMIHYWDDSNDDGQGWDWDEVTHWMPLPSAPAASKEGDVA